MTLDALLEEFHRKTGIVFGTSKQERIHQKIIRFFRSEGYEEIDTFSRALHNDRSLYHRLVNLLTVSETYFFREYAQIELFLQCMQERQGLKTRILCAPCASGEEPYSLLIALEENGFDLDNIEIFGIDINSDEIEKAKAGCYSARRLHRLNNEQRTSFFSLFEGCYCLRDELRQRVTFRVQNVFDTWPNDLEGFDIIFSRNMMIYFDEASKVQCENIFYSKLHPGGKLFLGHADFIGNMTGMEKETVRGISYYTKR